MKNTLNQYCLAMYGKHWVQLSVHERRVAYDSHRGDFSSLLGDLFFNPTRKK